MQLHCVEDSASHQCLHLCCLPKSMHWFGLGACKNPCQDLPLKTIEKQSWNGCKQYGKANINPSLMPCHRLEQAAHEWARHKCNRSSGEPDRQNGSFPNCDGLQCCVLTHHTIFVQTREDQKELCHSLADYEDLSVHGLKAGK